MTPDFIPIERRFRDLTNEELAAPEVLAAFDHLDIRGSLSWTELLDEPRVLVLAEAGSGKTKEMQSQAERLMRDGKYAFFVALYRGALRAFKKGEGSTVRRGSVHRRLLQSGAQAFYAWIPQPDRLRELPKPHSGGLIKRRHRPLFGPIPVKTGTISSWSHRRAAGRSTRTADSAERARLWPRMVEIYKPYDDYQSWSDRDIPLVILRDSSNVREAAAVR